jgi:hypothetical protein
MKKNYLSLILLLFALNFSFGQTTIIDFETAGDGYTPSTTVGAGFEDVFNRTNPNIGGNSTFIWSAEDFNGTPTIDIDQIDITGATSFEFSLDWVAHHYDDWDGNTEFSITYSIDGGAYQDLLSVRNICGCTNAPAAVDTDFNGIGECGPTTTLPSLTTGTADGCTLDSLRDQFETYTVSPVTVSGNTTLDIRLSFFNFTQNDQGIYLDNITIDVTGGGTPSCNITDISLSNSGSCNDNSTASDASDDYYTADVTITYSNAPASGTIDLTGTGVVGGATSVAVGTSPQTITGVQLAANGADVEISATFSAETTCNYTETVVGSGVASCSASGGSCTVVFSDDFSGTLSQWSNTGDWTIDTGELNHDLSGVAGESYIYADYGNQNLAADDYEWDFCIRNGNWDPSGGNNFTYYLISSDSDLQNNATGYAVGVNRTGSSDILTLYAVNGGTHTAIITSGYNWAPNDDVCIRVTRTSAGLWELFYSANATAEVSAGTVTDTTYTSGQYTGVFFDFSSTRAGLLWIDDINICGAAPSLAELQLVDDTSTNQNCGYTINFGSQVLSTNTDITFDIENNGTEDLDISSLSATGDFAIVSPSIPLTISPSTSETITVRFTPTITGTYSETLTILSNDADEGSCTVLLEGTGVACTPTHTITSFAPTEGPIGTVVTIVGSNFSNTTSVNFNGVASSNITYIDSDGDSIIDTLLAEVPATSTSGTIFITESGCNINSSSPFTVVDTLGGCSSSNLSDLIITELYDKGTGSLGYIEIYNGTGAAVNLSNYSIRRYGDSGDLLAGEYTLFTFPVTTPTIANNTALFGDVRSPGNTDNDATEDFTYDIDCSFTGGNPSCGGFNGSDIFHLYNGTTLIDVYENPNSGTGYTVTRDTNTAGPNSTSNPSDWNYSATESIADLGTFNYTGSSITYPSASAPLDVTGSCLTTASFTSIGTASIGGSLTYQWYFNDGSNSSWTIANNANLPLTSVSGETSNTLTIDGGLINYDNYQFYCLITENGACSSISNAAQLKIGTATWNGTNWIWNNGTALDTLPTTSANVIINDDYDTSNGGIETSFEACHCLVNVGNILTIENNTYVLVENDLTVNGNVVVRTDGSFVQINDAAIVNGTVLSDKTRVSVEKETAPLASYLEYTYWSSPVANEVISDGLFEAFVNRIFSFEGANFRDSTQEVNNDDATNPGQDDIDDDGNDWQFANGATVMSPGIGFAAMHSPIGFVPSRYVYTFEGPFNNGIYNIPIYRNDAELNDNNWNFIGNPYPSAIDADVFLAANASVDQTVGATNGAIFFWSHNTAADGNTNGNENLNYAQSDYAIINGSGQTAGGDGVVPTRFIPSGQGFFVSMDDGVTASVHSGSVMTTNVVFNNSMRVTGNNNQFFRTAQYNKLWLNLTSDNGVFNQVLVAYVDGATDGDDGMYYDANKNLSTDLYSGIYTTLDSSSDKKFAIQGKNPNSLNIDEVIPLGFSTSIEEATIYTISIYTTEGNFMAENDIFIIDYDLNIIHNLKTADYNFTANKGEFNNRFEIVFTPEALSVNDNTLTSNDLIITELNNGEVQIKVNASYIIENVEILDVLGRRIYNLVGNNSIEVYNLSKLSKAAYIARVTLSNGQVISKKAIKQQ